jgi:hypothetical protein
MTMPVIFRYKGFRFFFYSNEGDPAEPLHVHVRNGGRVAKIWLDPKPGIAESYGMNPSELHELLRIASEKRELIRKYWYEYFGI